MPEAILNLVMYHDVDIRFRYYNHIFYIRAMKHAANGRIYNYEHAISEEQINKAVDSEHIWQMIADRIIAELDILRKDTKWKRN